MSTAPASTAPAAPTAERFLTAEEYAALPDGRRTELVKGKVIEMPPPGFRHGEVQVEVASLLREHLRKHPVGRALVESGVVTTRGPDTVRGPDVSFYGYERVPKGQTPEVYAAAAPEFVFEILSPDDRTSEVLRKAAEYLAAGTLRVCVIDPRRRTAVLYGEDTHPTILAEDDALQLPPPLADWTPHVREFFPE